MILDRLVRAGHYEPLHRGFAAAFEFLRRKDLAEIPENVLLGLEIVPVAHVDEVLARALSAPVTPIEWTEADDLATDPNAGQGVTGDASLRH